MRQYLIYTCSALLCLLTNTGLCSEVTSHTDGPVSVHHSYDTIGKHIQYLPETAEILTLSDARKAYTSDQFSQWEKPVLSLGIGVSPVWLHFTVDNDRSNSIHRRLVIQNSWLDLAQLYIIKDGEVSHRQEAGDERLFADREVKHRFLVFDHEYTPGLSEVYIRVQTPDPMVLPIFFGDIDTASAHDVFDGYSYGLLYGILIALLLYNLSLFISIGQTRYIYYVLYLSMFLLMNISYTGHGYAYIWPGSIWLQKWINPISIGMVATTGIMFAFSFLNIRKLFPRLFFSTLVFCTLFWIAQISFLFLNMQTQSVISAVGFVMFFSVFTFYCALISFNMGHRDALYYLVATIATLIGSAITASTIWGFIPFSVLTYRAAEIAVSIDALLLSIALAEQFRRAQEEKVEAQQLARIDMLTSLNNRRAFNEVSFPLWHTAIRHEHETCIILLDLDEFKVINDTYGHATGDEVLKEISGVLNTMTREGDVLARWGGEEFIIMLPQTSLYHATQIAERIRVTISDLHIKTKLHELKITVSLGVAQKHSDIHELDDLIKLADKGLYQAKQSGRNTVCAN
ncbi:MAG TPA: GGDEF domain-containing protein [Gammaproteobacteria bacterium]|nr:GGDEF domain-containing protein [Gammaproteobacteria bacterium]